VLSSTRSVAGSPRRDTRTSGSRSLKNPRRSGASAARSTSVGDSSRAAGRSWSISGSVSRAKRVTRWVVARLSRRKVGSTLNVSASSSSRRAVTSQNRFDSTIRSRSWPWRSVSAANTSPVFRISRRVSPLWRRSTSSTSPVSSANGVSRASESLMAWAFRPTARPCWSSQTEKRLRVVASNVRRISSSSTVSET
jgi:hypothetical protein